MKTRETSVDPVFSPPAPVLLSFPDGIAQLIDQFLVADEFKLRHVIFFQICGVVYIGFNIVWYYVGWQENILYEVLDWDNKPLVACIYGAVCVMVLSPLFSLLHLFLYRYLPVITAFVGAIFHLCVLVIGDSMLWCFAWIPSPSWLRL